MKYKLLGACAAALCCAAPAFAQGLTRVEVLGLQQQQLRDDGCGITHTTGRVDAATRAAIKQCQSKYAGATDARSMLAAMKIGFGNGETAPTLASARAGAGGSMSAGGVSGSTSDTAAKGTVDLNKATPMTPPRSTMNPPLPKNTSTTTVDTSIVRDTSSMPADTFPKRDTIPSRDTLPRRDTMPTMPTMPKRDTLPRRDTMPKPDTSHSTNPRI